MSSSEDKNNDVLRKIESYSFYMSLSVLSIIALFSTLLILYLNDIINLFGQLESLINLKTLFMSFFRMILGIPISLFSSLKSLNLITIIVLGTIIYFYLVNYAKNKGATALARSTEESKSLNILFKIYGSLNFILFLFLAYLLLRGKLIELSILFTFYLVTKLLFIDRLLVKGYKGIIFDYRCLSELSSLENLKEVLSKVKSFSEELKEKKNKIRRFFLELRKSNLFSGFEKKTIWFLISHTNSFIKILYFIGLLLGLFSLTMDFNPLSIIYIELTSLVWAMVLIVVSNLPKKAHDVKMMHGNSFKDVYIIERTPEHIFIINSDNEGTKVFKHSIESISVSG